MVVIVSACKINGVVIVVNCCYAIGFATENNKNTVFFCNNNNKNNNKQQQKHNKQPNNKQQQTTTKHRCLCLQTPVTATTAMPMLSSSPVNCSKLLASNCWSAWRVVLFCGSCEYMHTYVYQGSDLTMESKREQQQTTIATTTKRRPTTLFDCCYNS